jgi:hypothetical protein
MSEGAGHRPDYSTGEAWAFIRVRITVGDAPPFGSVSRQPTFQAAGAARRVRTTAGWSGLPIAQVVVA